MFNLTLRAFRYPTDPAEFFVTANGTVYVIKLDKDAGIEDFMPAFYALLQQIGLTNLTYTVDTPVAIEVGAVFKGTQVSYLGTAPVITLAQNGTEVYYVSSGPTGLGIRQLAQVDGIYAARGRLGTYTRENVINWSSVVNPMDFTPAISTQANELRIKALKGKITKVLPTTEGFIIYSTGNIIRAEYIGGQEVFKFTSISEEGIVNPKYVAAAGDVHLLWTGNGLKTLDALSGSPKDTIPELTDLLTNYIMPLKLQILDNRYLVINATTNPYLGLSNADILNNTATNISLGTQPAILNYTDTTWEIRTEDGIEETFPVYHMAIIYDLITQRWGIMAKDYKALCSINPINQSGFKTEKDQLGLEARYRNYLKGMALLLDTNTLALCNDNEPTAYLRFGNFRLHPRGYTQINKVETEYADYSNAAITVIGSDDNRLLDSQTAQSSTKTVTAGQDNFYLTICKRWFNILVTGRFHLTRLTVEAHPNGS